MSAGVDTRDPATAYCSKDNIVLPSATFSSAAHQTALEQRAGEVQRGNNAPQASTYAGSGTAANRTNASKGRG